MLYNEPSPLEVKVLSRRFGLPNSASHRYLSRDRRLQGFLEKALGMTPEQIIDEVKARVCAGAAARVSHRHEVELRAAHVAQAEVHHGQRRRERAGHLQGPLLME
jgi:hypothetical protein